MLKAINEFMDILIRNITTPAKSYLFNLWESKKLDEQRAENFHNVIALLLFISRRCRLKRIFTQLPVRCHMYATIFF